MVYFAEFVGDGLVKIGHTSGSTKNRLWKLKFEYGLEETPKLIGTIPGRRPIEYKLHKVLSRYHHERETFYLKPEVREFIGVCIDTQDVELARIICEKKILQPADPFQWHDWDVYEEYENRKLLT